MGKAVGPVLVSRCHPTQLESTHPGPSSGGEKMKFRGIIPGLNYFRAKNRDSRQYLISR
jgi:hypothetical protein